MSLDVLPAYIHAKHKLFRYHAHHAIFIAHRKTGFYTPIAAIFFYNDKTNTRKEEIDPVTTYSGQRLAIK